jgi:hypothetical protein
MHCSSCSSSDQTEFTAELNIHFRGLKNIDHAGVLLIQEITVCLGCGHSRFTTPQTELAQLVSRTERPSSCV